MSSSVPSSIPRLNYATHGDPNNPSVLFLHGFMSCNGQWLLNTDALSEDFFLVTVELWGHGDSDCPQDPEYYALDAYYEQFELIRAALGIKQWSVIGQSYGAGIVMHYAADHPDICDAVVATNSRSAFGTLIEDRAGKELRELPENLQKLPYHPIHARRFPEHVKEALVTAADRMSLSAVELGGLLGNNLNCRKLVINYPLPLLITNGKYEKSFQEDLKVLKGTSPDLQVVDMEGGHSVNIEAAEAFNTAVRDFLSSVRLS